MEKNPLEDKSIVTTVEFTKGNPEAGESQLYMAFASDALLANPPDKPELCLFLNRPVRSSTGKDCALFSNFQTPS